MISIVIPTYNRVSALRQCLESIIPQHFLGVEIIVVDDASEDDTRQYLRQLEREFFFIHTVFNKKNGGVNYSRNQGIEKAKNPFILFLDSDDKLAEGGLQKVKEVLSVNLAVKHFLFIVSDRASEFMHYHQTENVLYKDWISGAVYGDFTHVVSTEIMKKYLFFEEFRMFEHLNWLRIKKLTSPQLLVPFIIALRERNRKDSLTSSMKLKNGSVIKSKFEAEKMYYSLYHNDLLAYNPKTLSHQLIQTIMLGAACNKRNDCRLLLRYTNRFYVKLIAFFIMLFPSVFLKYGIVIYSGYKSRLAA